MESVERLIKRDKCLLFYSKIENMVKYDMGLSTNKDVPESKKRESILRLKHYFENCYRIKYDLPLLSKFVMPKEELKSIYEQDAVFKCPNCGLELEPEPGSDSEFEFEGNNYWCWDCDKQGISVSETNISNLDHLGKDYANYNLTGNTTHIQEVLNDLLVRLGIMDDYTDLIRKMSSGKQYLQEVYEPFLNKFYDLIFPDGRIDFEKKKIIEDVFGQELILSETQTNTDKSMNFKQRNPNCGSFYNFLLNKLYDNDVPGVEPHILPVEHLAVLEWAIRSSKGGSGNLLNPISKEYNIGQDKLRNAKNEWVKLGLLKISGRKLEIPKAMYDDYKECIENFKKF